MIFQPFILSVVIFKYRAKHIGLPCNWCKFLRQNVQSLTHLWGELADTNQLFLTLIMASSYSVSNFEYLGYSVSYNASNDVVNKLHKFNLMCGTIRRTLKSASKGTRLKFYKVMALQTVFYGYENWTLMKGQASRIQAA